MEATMPTIRPERLETVDEFRKFLNGPCARAAQRIIDEGGVLNFEGDGDVLTEAIADVEGPAPFDLVEQTARSREDALAYDALKARMVASYLVGLAVGRRIGDRR
jgi:hypothetical protein